MKIPKRSVDQPSTTQDQEKVEKSSTLDQTVNDKKTWGAGNPPLNVEQQKWVDAMAKVDANN